MTKLWLNWDYAPNEANYLAQDASGRWYWFAGKPASNKTLRRWVPDNAGYFSDNSPAILAAVTEPDHLRWQQTLQERPTESTGRSNMGATEESEYEVLLKQAARQLYDTDRDYLEIAGLVLEAIEDEESIQ